MDSTDNWLPIDVAFQNAVKEANREGITIALYRVSTGKYFTQHYNPSSYVPIGVTLVGLVYPQDAPV